MAQLEDFYQLSPDIMLDLVESTIEGRGRVTGYCVALNSLENRVVEIEFDDKSRVVAKFYRPGRWSSEQIQEEHRFIEALQSAEIPVVAALALKKSKYAEATSCPTLCKSREGIHFSVYPKYQGRIENELGDDQVRVLGRFLGRIHAVGATFKAKYRWKLDAKNWIDTSLTHLMNGDFLKSPMAQRYQQVVEELKTMLINKCQSMPLQSIHGDCHLGNTLWQYDNPVFLDFDDMMLGPAVQDIWMIIRGDDEEAHRQREVLISSYESMREFDWNTLHLVEALRALRIIHFSGWIAKRWNDPSFPKTFLNFGKTEYWQEEIMALEKCREKLHNY